MNYHDVSISPEIPTIPPIPNPPNLYYDFISNTSASQVAKLLIVSSIFDKTLTKFDFRPKTGGCQKYNFDSSKVIPIMDSGRHCISLMTTYD